MPNLHRQYIRQIERIFAELPRIADGHAPAPPELDNGTMHIKTTTANPTLIGVTVVEEITAGVEYKERWVYLGDNTFPSNTSFDAIKVSENDWATELDLLKQEQGWEDFLLGIENCVNQSPPNATTIAQLPDVPTTATLIEFNLRTLVGNNAPFDSGGLYRQVLATSPITVVDTWRLLPNYVLPTGGANGTRTRAVVQNVANTHTQLRDFLTAYLNGGGVMVHVSYQLNPLG